MSYALRALKKNIIKQEKQEKTRLVLFCFTGFILFFLSGRLRILYPLDLRSLVWQELIFFSLLSQDDLSNCVQN
jgi:hypothetical protein